MKPILFMDVDGVLNPFKANPRKFHRLGLEQKYYRVVNQNGKAKFVEWVDKSTYDFAVKATNGKDHADFFPFVVKKSIVPILKNMIEKFNFVWGTTWENDANLYVSPIYDLPVFPFVEFKSYQSDNNLHWKTRQLFDWADGTPFIWFDDDLSRSDNLFLQGHGCSGVRVDPYLGFTDSHYNKALKWLAGL